MPYRSVRVLAVDDEDDARHQVARIVRALGFDVVEANNAGDAFRIVLAFRPDVIVSDIGMPDETGFSLLKRVRALSVEQGGSTPAIAVTGWTSAKDIETAKAVGFDAVIPKPLDATELRNALSAFVGFAP